VLQHYQLFDAGEKLVPPSAQTSMDEGVMAAAQAGAIAFFTGHGHSHMTPEFGSSKRL
jgi:hypothetical protein